VTEHDKNIMLILIKDDLGAFFAEHFSDGALKTFGLHIFSGGVAPLSPHQTGLPEAEEAEDDEDDGLGYYPDGVKRTLTDEQIAMFRHSELHALERAGVQRVASLRHESSPGVDGIKLERAISSGGIEEEGGELSKSVPSDGRKRKRKGKGSRPVKKEPKPDLRKRTWDMVEKGLDSLDYG